MQNAETNAASASFSQKYVLIGRILGIELITNWIYLMFLAGGPAITVSSHAVLPPIEPISREGHEKSSDKLAADKASKNRHKPATLPKANQGSAWTLKLYSQVRRSIDLHRYFTDALLRVLFGQSMTIFATTKSRLLSSRGSRLNRAAPRKPRILEPSTAKN